MNNFSCTSDRTLWSEKNNEYTHASRLRYAEGYRWVAVGVGGPVERRIRGRVVVIPICMTKAPVGLTSPLPGLN